MEKRPIVSKVLCVVGFLVFFVQRGEEGENRGENSGENSGENTWKTLTLLFGQISRRNSFCACNQPFGPFPMLSFVFEKFLEHFIPLLIELVCMVLKIKS